MTHTTVTAIIVLAANLWLAGCCGDAEGCKPKAESDTAEQQVNADEIREYDIELLVLDAEQEPVATEDEKNAHTAQEKGLMYGLLAHSLSAYDEARRALEPFARQGEALAALSMGLMAVNGEGQPVDFATAMQWFLVAAQAGNPRAHYDVGLMYELGEGVAVDFARAYYWYDKGAGLDSEDCIERLGRWYLLGRYVDEDVERGLSLLRQAAAMGDTDAMHYLGMWHATRSDADIESRREGLPWLQQAAEHGRVVSRFDYPQLLWVYARDEKERTQAIRFLEEFMYSPDALEIRPVWRMRAWSVLMRAYLNGWGVPQNEGTALDHAARIDAMLKENDAGEWSILGATKSEEGNYAMLQGVIKARSDLASADPLRMCEALDYLPEIIRMRVVGQADIDAAEAAITSLVNQNQTCLIVGAMLQHEGILCEQVGYEQYECRYSEDIIGVPGPVSEVQGQQPYL